MKKTAVIVILAVACAVAAWIWCSRSGDGPATEGERSSRREEVPAAPAGKAVADVPKAAVTNAVKVRRPQAFALRKNKRGKAIKVARGTMVQPTDGVYRDDDGKPYPEADQKLLRQADKAVEKDDVKSARALADSALKSKNTAVRKAAVEALSWFGENALAELTLFLSDADSEVAESAKDAWMQGLTEMEDEAVKASIVEMALRGLKDGEMIDDIANELVGLDEKCALQTICNLIEKADGRAVTAAKDAYESITGDKWTGAKAAETWLKENYVAEE